MTVIAGGGSGIGRAMSLGYAKEGARVVVLDANAETAAETEKSITGGGCKGWSFKLDVTDLPSTLPLTLRPRSAKPRCS